MFRSVGLVLSGVAFLLPSISFAHGAFPESRDVLFEQPEDEHPVVLTTFGVLVAEESDYWHWVCEEIAGGGALTTSFEVLDTGRWLIGTGIGLWWSDDRCNWSNHEGELGYLNIAEIKRVEEDHSLVWVASSDEEQPASMWRSTDHGQSFQAYDEQTFGAKSTATSLLLDGAGQPYFVSGGVELEQGFWLLAQGSWQRHAVDTAVADAVYALEGQPADKDKIYVTLRSGLGDGLGRITADGSVQTLLGVELIQDWIVAFETSEDGQIIMVGGRSRGMFTSTDGGQSWSEPLVSPEPGCLTRKGDQFYQCANNWIDGQSVLSGSEPGTLDQSVLRFGDVREPLVCPEGSDVEQTCYPLWDSVLVYGLNDPLPTPTPTPISQTPEEQNEDSGGCFSRADDNNGAVSFLPLYLLAAAAFRRQRR